MRHLSKYCLCVCVYHQVLQVRKERKVVQVWVCRDPEEPLGLQVNTHNLIRSHIVHEETQIS